MKTCGRCGVAKALNDFTGSSKKSSWCKSCHRAYCREHYANNKFAHNSRRQLNNKVKRQANRQKLFTYLTLHPCVVCGETDPILLEFDHLDASTKINNVSYMYRNTFSDARIQAEVKKCQVLCVRCHRLKTAQQFNWYKDVIKGY